MGLLGAVQTQHQHHMVIVQELHVLIGKQGAVGGQGQFDVLAGFFFSFAHVFHNVLHHRVVHHRFPAKQIQFQVVALLATFDGKFHGLVSHFVAHQGTVTAKVPGVGKAVPAAQVAVMGHMEAQGFQYRSFPEGIRYGEFRREQKASGLEFL